MQKHKSKIICFIAGHSGGHIIPCLTLSNKYTDYKINFITTNKKLDNEILQNKNINKIVNLNLNKIPNNIFHLPKFAFLLIYSFFKSCIFLIKNRPEKLISTGGLIAIPTFFAAKLLRIKLEIYELNVEPGKTTKFLEKLNPEIKICFQESQKYFNKKCTLVDYPVRFSENDKLTDKSKIYKKINFNSNKKTILILGGSQGSIFLNDITQKFLNKYNLQNIQIIHQTGANDKRNWTEFYKKKNISNLIFSYNQNIQDFYLISDLILCRAGAGTLAEIIFFNKKCITIPLETNTTNHQVLNATTLAKKHTNIVAFKQNEMEHIFKMTINFLEN